MGFSNKNGYHSGYPHDYGTPIDPGPVGAGPMFGAAAPHAARLPRGALCRVQGLDSAAPGAGGEKKGNIPDKHGKNG